jgi:hypothetical protein
MRSFSSVSGMMMKRLPFSRAMSFGIAFDGLTAMMLADVVADA